MTDKKMTEEQQKLVIDNYNLIYKIVDKIHAEQNVLYDKDDLCQTALEAMCEAAIMYNKDNEQKAAFSTYACNAIANRLYRAANKYREDDKLSLNGEGEICFSDEEDESITVGIECTESGYAACEILADFDAELRRIENMSPKMKRAIAVYRMDRIGYTVKETCRQLGIKSYATYYELLNAAKAQLKINLGYN